MAVANFQYKIFNSASELHAFAIANAACDTIISIVFDAGSSKFVLFYTGT